MNTVDKTTQQQKKNEVFIMRINNFSFSEGNSKMQYVGSFSVMPGLTCAKNAPCGRECYAKKLVRIYPSTAKAYSDNTDMLMNKEMYSEFVEATCKFISKKWYNLFRFNVAGDFFSYEYLAACCEIAKRNKKVKFLAFTKQYDIAYKAINKGIVPKNFNIVFSAWLDFMPENTGLVPVAYFDDGAHKELIDPNAKKCNGNCMNCKKCFNLKAGKSVYFEKH